MNQAQARDFLNDPKQVAKFFTQFEAWGWRVRRDVLAMELFLKIRHGSDWEAFSERIDLSRDMTVRMSKNRVRMLLEALGYDPDPAADPLPHQGVGHGGRSSDPGAPPIPPLD